MMLFSLTKCTSKSRPPQGVDLSVGHVVFPATNQNTLGRFGGSKRNCWSCAVFLEDGFLKKSEEGEHEHCVLCQDLEEGALHLLMHPTDAPFEGPHAQVDRSIFEG